MNNFENLIKERRTVHEYTDQLVDSNLLSNILETSLYAPNHKLTHPVRFNELGPSKRKDLINLSIKLREKKNGPLTDDERLAVLKKFNYPSHLIFISQIKNSDPSIQKEDYATLSCVVHNISLLLWEKGIGLKWSTGKILETDELFQILNLNRKEENIEGLLYIGYPETIRKAPKRPPLSDILRKLN